MSIFERRVNSPPRIIDGIYVGMDKTKTTLCRAAE